MLTAVGALGGQADGEEQLIGLGILQGAEAVGVEPFQLLHDGDDILVGFHRITS